MENYKTLREVPGTNGKYFISIDTKEGICIATNYGRMGISKPLSNKLRKKDRIYWHLYINSKSVTYQACKWIAITYPELIENEYFDGAEIDHINTDPMDNRPENLRWVTRKGNMSNPLTLKHLSKSHKGLRTGYHHTEETKSIISQKNKGKKRSAETRKKISDAAKKRDFYPHPWMEKVNEKKRRPVIQTEKDTGQIICVYDSITAASIATGIVMGSISNCLAGRSKSTKGKNGTYYSWKYN